MSWRTSAAGLGDGGTEARNMGALGRGQWPWTSGHRTVGTLVLQLQGLNPANRGNEELSSDVGSSSDFPEKSTIQP